MEDGTAIPSTPTDGDDHDANGHAESPEPSKKRTLVRSIPAQIGRGLILGLVLYVLWLMIQLFL